MGTNVLIDDHVSTHQCEKALNALLVHALKKNQQTEETELLGGREQHVWLNVTVKQMQPEKKLKPFKIPIVHPLVDPRTSSICLITKDPQREYKDLLEKHSIKFISRVVGVEKLKGKFKPFEARRLLLKENGLFLADERVIPLLPGLLGNAFFKAKKQPIPVNLTRKNLKGELEAAISSTYFHQNKGTNSSVKIGTLSQTPVQILANIQKALPAVITRIKGGWDNIQSLHIKTSFSVALPVWSCELGAGEGARWDGMVADVEMSEGEKEEEEAGDSDEEMEIKEAEPKGGAKKGAEKEIRGKKRAAKDDHEDGSGSENQTRKATATPESSKSPLKKAKTAESTESAPPPKASKKRKAHVSTKGTEEISSTLAVTEPSIVAAPAAQTSSSVAVVVEAEEGLATKKKRKRSKKAEPQPPSTQPSESTPSAEVPAPAGPTPTSEEAPVKKKRRKSKIDVEAPSKPEQPSATSAIQTSVVPSSIASTTETSKPRKRKKAKAEASATAFIPQADSSKPSEPVPPLPSAPKPSSQSGPTTLPIEPRTPAPASSKKKKARASAADSFEGVKNGGEGLSQPPSTPAGAAVPSGVVVPPNTPAGGLLSQTQSQAQVAQTPAPKEKKKRKQKGKASDAVPSATVTATPVSGAIGKLTVKDGAATRSLGDNVNAVGSPILDRKGTKAPQSETNPALGEGIIADDGNDRSLDAPVEVKTKKGRRKKEKKGKPVPAEGVASDALVEVPPEEKQSGATSEKEKKEEMGGDGKVVKKRKRSKKVDGQEDGLGSVPVSVAAPSIVTKSASGPTPEEVKQKRSSTGVEKKKAKIAKGKRGGETVKESLVGKKGL